MNEKEKRNKVVGTILIMSMLLVVIGTTFAAFVYTGRGTKENSVTTSTISFKYNETSNGVTLTNAYPMSDSEGKKQDEQGQTYFDFDVTSTIGADTEIQYFVYAVDITGDVENKLDPKYVKVYLTDQSSPENAYEGYDGEVPVYSELDNVQAKDKEGGPVEGKLLYQNKFIESGEHKYRLRLWVSDEYETKEVSETFKLRVDVNTDASITSSDEEKPTCEVVNVEPNKVTREEDINMTIKCSDNNGVVTSNLTKDNIHVKVDNEEVTPTTKELTEGIAPTSFTGKTGVQHTLTLNGFDKSGDITITIDSGVITDKKGNTNDEITLETKASIYERVTVTLANGGGVTSYGEQDTLTCDLKDSDTCNVTLPTITPTEGYTGSFWSEEETAKEGKEPGSVEVSSDTTYYAIGYKEVTATFTVGDGVDSVGKENDTCTYYGKETSCKIELPTIKSKTGYNEGYFTTGEDELTPGEQVDVSDNIEYTATAKDTTPPVCSLVDVTPKSVKQKDEEVTVTIKCTDTSGSITKDLSVDSLSIKIDGEPGTATITEEGSGTDIDNGRQHVYKIKDFSTTGENLILVVEEGAVEDAGSNKNNLVSLTLDVAITSVGYPLSQFISENTNSGSSWSSGSAESHKMYNVGNAKRYIGDTPYNYLKFEGDPSNTVWRIIGVFTDPSSTNDTSERLKIMKQDSIGKIKWDDNNSNNWANASLQKNLNSGDYWNGLAQVTKNSIETMNWYLGGVDSNYSSYSTAQYYSKERGSTPAGSSGASSRWTGNVGLIYPSDYGYTFANGVYTTCYNTLSNYNNCKSLRKKSWMWVGDSSYPWTITPRSDRTSYVFAISADSGFVAGNVDANDTSMMIRPVVYLKSDIPIKEGGTGEENNPYIIAK